MPIPCLVPSILSNMIPQYASFVRTAGGSGEPSNWTHGKTIAEMFDWYTDIPIFGTIIIPSNCILWDKYGYYGTNTILDYTPKTVPGAVRLDDLHADSIVLIVNYGNIYGAGGAGGMGHLKHWRNIGPEFKTADWWAGGGGGAGQGYSETKGGMGAWGSYNDTIDEELYLHPPTVGEYEGAEYDHADDLSYVNKTLTDGEDYNISGDTGQGGKGYTWTCEGWLSEGYGDIVSYTPEDWPSFVPPHWSDVLQEWDYEKISEVWGADPEKYGTYAASGAYRAWMGGYFWHTNPATEQLQEQAYTQNQKAIFGPQGGTAGIVCGCTTYISNNETAVAKIFGGGGGGVGGDYTGYLDGRDGGIWGTASIGTNYYGKVGGVGGYAVQYNEHEVTWLEGNNPTQVKGLAV